VRGEKHILETLMVSREKRFQKKKEEMGRGSIRETGCLTGENLKVVLAKFSTLS
jgi:hypothetical protein